MIFTEENVFLKTTYKRVSHFFPWLLGNSKLNLKSVLGGWLILSVNLAKPQYPDNWSNITLYVSVKICLDEINI